MRSGFEAAEGSYNILWVNSVSSPIYRVFQKIARKTSFWYMSNYSEVPIIEDIEPKLAGTPPIRAIAPGGYIQDSPKGLLSGTRRGGATNLL